jgi:xylulose-5-phosphate/fructose-6-phosphate phosphoketolase
MKKNTLTLEALQKTNAYWRPANYLSVGQIYLYANPLLNRPLKLSGVTPCRRAVLGETAIPIVF